MNMNHFVREHLEHYVFHLSVFSRPQVILF
jgi:hypothetical protein